MGKNELRRRYLTIREALPQAARDAKSLFICSQLKALPFFQQARHVLFYYPVGCEVNLLSLMREMLMEEEKSKVIYLPKIGGGDVVRALPILDMDDLEVGSFAIPEPPERGGEFDSLIDLVVVPGVAFDSQGGRLGMGKGYYDRYLGKHPHMIKIGVAFSEQMTEKIPTEAHDVRLDGVLTD